MWDTHSFPGFGAGVVQRSWHALQGYARASFGAVAAKAHSIDTHETLHHLLTGRRGRLIKVAFGLGVAACLAVIAVSHGVSISSESGPHASRSHSTDTAITPRQAATPRPKATLIRRPRRPVRR
jgi:hypothetical protein